MLVSLISRWRMLWVDICVRASTICKNRRQASSSEMPSSTNFGIIIRVRMIPLSLSEKKNKTNFFQGLALHEFLTKIIKETERPKRTGTTYHLDIQGP